MSEYLPFAILFLVTGLAQAALAVATIWWPSWQVLAVAALVAIGYITVWFVSRTVGLPIVPSEKLDIEPSAPVSIFVQIATANGQLSGALTRVIELASILLYCVLLIVPGRPRPSGRWWLAGAIPSGAMIMLVTFIGVSAGGFNSLPQCIKMSTASRASASLTIHQRVEPPGLQPLKTFDIAH